MKKKVRMLMTLEDVGCSGKFFNDNITAKMCGIIIAYILFLLLIAGQLASILPSWISFLVGFIVLSPLAFWLTSKFVLRQKELCRISEEMENGHIISCNKYSDIYKVSKEGLCDNTSGHKSLYISVDRLHTIGMTEDDIEEYYNVIEQFESALLSPSNNFKVKYYEIEDVDKFRGAIDYEHSLIPNINNKAINTTTILKNKYINSYINEYGVDYTIVYVVYTKMARSKDFLRQVKNAMTYLNNPHIGNVHLMNKREIDKFGETFFNVKYFDCVNMGDKIDDNLIKFEEDVI